MRRRRRTATVTRAVLMALAATLLSLPAAALGGRPAQAADFPAGYRGYHTYAEMAAEVAAVAAAHPDIVSRFSIGRSYRGREIWAAKVSDNVGVDEPEPEVLFEGLHHADEHMSLEMTLRILHWLADGYGSDERITRIVDSREIWIVFAVNPDGAEYDIAAGRFHWWRKNRQPNAGTTAIGTDLNRNYGYRWGGRGSSSNPRAITYRGPAAFSAPETRAMRDFLAGRVVDGRQQIRASVSFHEAGRLVMWPYGYTYVDVPPDMTRQDHDALRIIGRRMASLNGYRPQQASDLYLTSGTTRDYLYGRYRVFSYTFELSTRDYPDDALIPRETGRNRTAVLYLIERAWCPLSVLGAAIRAARCGAFDDDLEVARGWTVDADGTDTATVGAWARGDAKETVSSGTKQAGVAPSGRGVLATGLPAGGSAGAYDLDGGSTSVTSPPIRLSAVLGQRLTFRYYLAHGADSSPEDQFRAEVVDASGLATTVVIETGAADGDDAVWASASAPMDDWAGQTVRIRFVATDGGADSLVEAAVDDVRVTRPG